MRGALAIAAVLAALGALSIWSSARAAGRAKAALAQDRAEMSRLRADGGVVGARGAEALEEKVAAWEAQRDALRESLRPRNSVAQRFTRAAPPSAADAYFELAGFQQEMRERARRCGVQLGAEEAFGFAQYRHAGPQPATIPAVFRQRLVVEHLLELLFAAAPRELLRVRREDVRVNDVRVNDEPESVYGSGLRRSGADELGSFLSTPAGAARMPGVAAASAFELVFSGDTAVLRRLLNAIAGSDLALRVRRVEVSPMTRIDAANAQAPSGERIEPAPSRFTVLVEWIELQEAEGEVN